jgi:hypothetical protein
LAEAQASVAAVAAAAAAARASGMRVALQAIAAIGDLVRPTRKCIAALSAKSDILVLTPLKSESQVL